MEKWDAYNSKLEKIEGMTLIRGEEDRIPEGVYHIVTGILVKHSDGTYLLMKRDLRKSCGGMWEATAGGSALIGETPLQCAVRELKEETGIESNELTQLWTVVCDETHSIYVEYLCVTNWEKQNITLQAGETIDFRWVTAEELCSMSQSELVSRRMQKYVEETTKENNNS